MAAENLFDFWARRNPKWEARFEEILIRKFTDYGVGASELTMAREKHWVQVTNFTYMLSS